MSKVNVDVKCLSCIGCRVKRFGRDLLSWFAILCDDVMCHVLAPIEVAVRIRCLNVSCLVSPRLQNEHSTRAHTPRVFFLITQVWALEKTRRLRTLEHSRSLLAVTTLKHVCLWCVGGLSETDCHEASSAGEASAHQYVPLTYRRTSTTIVTIVGTGVAWFCQPLPQRGAATGFTTRTDLNMTWGILLMPNRLTTSWDAPYNETTVSILTSHRGQHSAHVIR